ncbi:multiheme c-type cytochrome [Nannocystis bainbridge]|uniref:Multiheme c-type cytochrome n=1 Tax=Nannocystis bainbridge TaxID=2995303 RepID=A0ABT5E0Y4_9BACT|nr:multiheme c-type cytochrome [Nannocystis bainbridge]MDC0718974.1 multiheme c-type cytochrome [Nannocystis bainbridge]
MAARAHLVLLVALLTACDGRRAPPAREPAITWLPREDECAACHAEVADAWARSRHHAAFTNDEFQRSYAREPTPFCRDCHAPARPRMPAADAELLGVGCLDCHGGPGTIVTAAIRAGSDAPHVLRRDPAFPTRACAPCHEFDFPDGSAQARGTMMQTTMREHQRSPHADRSCADCHMPAAAHDFASTRDPAAMQRALEVVARRDGDALELELRTRDVGHAFPTGDLFRRLAVHAALVGPDGRELARDVRYLARHFVPRHHLDGRLRHAASLPVVDDRIHGAAGVRLELHPGEASPAALVWHIDLERVDARDPDRPEASTIADTIRLAEGRLPPITPASSP